MATPTRQLLIHLLLILCLSMCIVLGFFYLYLPNATNHGDTVEVPNLEGMSIEEMEEFLDEKSLRFQVSDCTFVKDKKPLTVLSQYPKAGAKVKDNRHIYVTVSAISPPKVKMPNLVDASLRNAQLVLQSYDLILDKVKFVPHYAKNAVLKQFVGSREVKPGEYLPKGSHINLLVGDGLSSSKVAIPNLVGINYSEAGGILEALELNLGTEIWDESSSEDAGTIIRQKPSFVMGDSIQKGQMVDIWIAGKNPKESALSTKDTL